MTLTDWQRVAREFGDKDIEVVGDAYTRWITYDDEWTVGYWLPSEPTAKEILRLRKRVEVLERVREAADLACRQYASRSGPVLIPMEVLGRLLDEAGAAKPAAQEGKEAADGN